MRDAGAPQPPSCSPTPRTVSGWCEVAIRTLSKRDGREGIPDHSPSLGLSPCWFGRPSGLFSRGLRLLVRLERRLNSARVVMPNPVAQNPGEAHALEVSTCSTCSTLTSTKTATVESMKNGPFPYRVETAYLGTWARLNLTEVALVSNSSGAPCCLNGAYPRLASTIGFACWAPVHLTSFAANNTG
jgi:hypothetical protein